MIPKLIVVIAQEDELRVRVEADSDADRDALYAWLESRADFRAFIDVLRLMYENASNDGV
jgi:hypothetical protein